MYYPYSRKMKVGLYTQKFRKKSKKVGHFYNKQISYSKLRQHWVRSSFQQSFNLLEDACMSEQTIDFKNKKKTQKTKKKTKKKDYLLRLIFQHTVVDYDGNNDMKPNPKLNQQFRISTNVKTKVEHKMSLVELILGFRERKS